MSRPVLIMTALAGLALTACGSEEHQDIKQWMNEVTKDMRGRVPPLPEIRYCACSIPRRGGSSLGDFSPSRARTSCIACW